MDKEQRYMEISSSQQRGVMSVPITNSSMYIYAKHSHSLMDCHSGLIGPILLNDGLLVDLTHGIALNTINNLQDCRDLVRSHLSL